MNTVAVQQASQMVEIQGAPATAQATGDEFRVTFAASVGDAAGQRAVQRAGGIAAGSTGVSSAGGALAAGLLVKKVSRSESGVTQSLLALNGDVPNRDVSELAANANSALVLKDAQASDADSKTSIANVDSRPAVLTRVGDEALVDPAPAIVQLPVAANWSAASTTVPKHDTPSKPVDSEAGARGSKTEASGPNKGLSHAKAQGDLPGIAIAGGLFPDAVAISQAQPVPTPQGGPIVEKGSKTAVLSSVVQASDDMKTVSGGPIHYVDTRDLIPTSAGLNEVPIVQGDAFAVAGAKAIGDATPVGQRGSLAGGATESTAKNYLIVPLPHYSEDGGPKTTKTLAGLGVAASAVAGPFGGSGVGETRGQTHAGQNNTELKANASAESSARAAVSQTRAITVPHAGLVAQSLGASQSTPSKIVSTAQDSPTGLEDKDSGIVPRLNGASETPAYNVSAPMQIAANGPQQLEVVRETALASASVHEAVSKVVVPTTKDDKTKAALAGGEDTAANQSSVTMSAVSEMPGGSASSPVNLTSIVPARAINAADAAVPLLQTTPHVGGSSTHTPTAVADPTASRALSAGGAVSEPSGSVAQVADSHRTLLATPTTLEVGVQSGTQGWLRIRAEVGDQGAVNASLAAASSGGRELLHSQMPALNAFLHSEHMPVTATVIDRGSLTGGGQGGAALGSGGLGSQDESGASSGSLLHGGTQSGGGERGPSHQTPSVSASGTTSSYNARTSVNEAEASLPGRVMSSGESGRWLNIRV